MGTPLAGKPVDQLSVEVPLEQAELSPDHGLSNGPTTEHDKVSHLYRMGISLLYSLLLLLGWSIAADS